MPPRHAYWTILIGDSPTAFRAREREELLPTFERLRAKQPDAVLKWFERGRLWASPEEARGPAPSPAGPPERRGKEWRPGGAHRDPRDRFKKDKKPGARGHDDRGGPPPTDRPRADRPRDERPRDDRGPGAPRRPWQPKADPRAARPAAGERTDRPWRPKPDQAAWRQAVAAKTARRRAVRPAVAAQTPGSGRPTGPGGQSRRAIGATDRGGQSRPTRASSVRGSRSRRLAQRDTDRARRASGRGNPSRLAPINVPGLRSQKAATDRGGPSPLGIAATSHGGPSLPGHNRPAVAAQASGRPRRKTLAAKATEGRGEKPWRPKPDGAPGGKPWRPKPDGGVGHKPSGPKPQGGSRPPREKDDQGPPNDRSPREERGRKGGTRLVKKVRR